MVRTRSDGRGAVDVQDEWTGCNKLDRQLPRPPRRISLPPWSLQHDCSGSEITEVISGAPPEGTFGVRSAKEPLFGDIMKRFAAFVLLAIFSVSLAVVIPAHAQRMTPEQNARQSRKAEKKQRKALKKSAKKQRKAMKRAAKAQRKATKKANRDLQKRRGHR